MFNHLPRSLLLKGRLAAKLALLGSLTVCLTVVFGSLRLTAATYRDHAKDVDALGETPPDPNAILFVGNSHTGMHNLPDLVIRMMNFRLKDGKATFRYLPVADLEGAMANQNLQREIASGNWGTIVLQAQKISSSGKYHYSTDVGVELAKRCRKNGCRVFFFSEWGIRNVESHSEFTEKIYRTMAEESGSECIPVGKVWEAVISAAPKTALYSDDGNHQSKLGASLTALVIACRLLGKEPSAFRDYRVPEATQEQWELFQDKVEDVLSKESSNVGGH